MSIKNFNYVLASTSPRRRHLLTQLGVHFKIVAPNINESYLNNETPLAYVKRMATTKMKAALDLINTRFNQKTLVISADTIVVLDGLILGKPKNLKQSTQYLNQLAGKKHQVMTGFCICVINAQKKIYWTTKVVASQVWFRPLSKEEIKCYVKSKEGLDKAGGYAIQGDLGMALIDSIKGSYTNIIGLPLCELKKEIEKAMWIIEGQNKKR